MLRPLIFSAFLSLFLSSSLLAIDMSEDASQDSNLRRDKSMSTKASEDDRDSIRNTDSKSKQAQHSVDVTYDAVPVYLLVADKCVVQNMTAADFAISPKLPNGDYDLVMKQLIDVAAGASSPISEVGGRDAELKSYLKCAIGNYAKMAQSNIVIASKLGKHRFSANQILNLSISTFSSDLPLSSTISALKLRAIKEVDSGTCTFFGSPNVVRCGAVIFDFSQHSIKLSNALLSPGADKFFGVGTSFRVSLTDSVSVASDVANEYARSHGREFSLSKVKSSSDSESSKQQLNISPFIPK